MFRQLRADEIECRISTVKAGGLSLLLYKDARCDMNILDESVGPENWQRFHSRDNANCTVSIWDTAKKQWIAKEDTGTESFSQKEKGLASDSFKRACFNWGIGRELYTAPFIWIPSSECTIKEKSDKKGFTCFDNFYVSEIGYDDKRCINHLQIKHARTGKVVYELGKNEHREPEKVTMQKENPSLKILADKCKKHNIDLKKWARQFGPEKTVDALNGKEIASMLVWIKENFGDE